MDFVFMVLFSFMFAYMVKFDGVTVKSQSKRNQNCKNHNKWHNPTMWFTESAKFDWRLAR
jgi:hypothetical protein